MGESHVCRRKNRPGADAAIFSGGVPAGGGALSASRGFGALWLLNLTTSVTGLSLGLSWFNAIVIGILGVPGFGLLLLVQWVLT